MGDIIEFNSRKKQEAVEIAPAQDEANTISSLQESFLDFLQSSSDNSFLDDLHKKIWNRFQRLIILETISRRVREKITAAGMDASLFRIDPVAFDRFQTREIDVADAQETGEWPIPPELYWNGPYYDWNQDGTLIRAATTVLRHESGEIELLVDLVKMPAGSKYWLMWHDGVWETDDFLEAVEEELRRRQIEALGPAAIGYDDDVVDIFTLSLSLRVVTALCEGGIMTVGELCEMTEEKLLDIWGIGPKAIEEIKEALEEEGLSLREG